MPQVSLGRGKKRGFGSRLLELAFLAGIEAGKIDPQRKGFQDYQESHEFPKQQVPSDLDVQAGREEGSEGHASKFSDPSFPLKSPEIPNPLERPIDFPGRSARR